MCAIFIGADARLYQTRTRWLRLHGLSTSLRLENFFWTIPTEIGARGGMTLNQLIAKLHDELAEAGRQTGNFASFLRVCCARYLALQRDERIPTDNNVSLRSLDPAFVLAEERRGRAAGIWRRLANAFFPSFDSPPHGRRSISSKWGLLNCRQP